LKPKHPIFNPAAITDFDETALAWFRFQHLHVAVYRQYCDYLGVLPNRVKELHQIPFLPISAFKNHPVICEDMKPQQIFESSGTTGEQTSKHFVADTSLYEKSFRAGFRHFYGQIEDYAVVALLPSYLERKNASLVYMVQDWIQASGHPLSGFYLDEHEKLHQTLLKLIATQQKVIFIGVTFALLDFAEKYSLPPNNLIIMETGGMKGRRKEPVRSEAHAFLCQKLGVSKIHSEYGMTELLSQAYSKGDGIFNCPPWMKILIRDPEDPLSYLAEDKIGGINVIDLANLNSCAFIATQDLGKKHSDESFEVLGRFDHSDVRGCSLMVK
jgi:phenylacetate-coenzyme A ligase PaaK-like adenylate-forming protein